MFSNRNCFASLLLIIALLLCACRTETPLSPDAPSNATDPDAVSRPTETEESLPQSEQVVLVYESYMTATASRDGITYTYTYCFDENGNVFNAEAKVDFPTEADAVRTYAKFLKNGYINLSRREGSLYYAFRKKECPYYGVSYRVLPLLLEESIYEIVDEKLPDDTSKNGRAVLEP